MKPVVGRILAAVYILTFCAGIGALVYASRAKRHTIACNNLEITLPGPHQFLTEDDIRKELDFHYDTYIGQRVEDVDIARIEAMMYTKAEIQDSQAWITDDGTLHISLVQRDPVLRVEHKGNGYYVDSEGFIFPLSDNYTADVPVISCDPRMGFDKEWLTNIISLVRYIKSDASWKGRITDFEIAEDGDIILLGNELKVVYGDFSERKRKQDAIVRYFNVIEPRNVDDPYKYVNLKYKGQIICRKG